MSRTASAHGSHILPRVVTRVRSAVARYDGTEDMRPSATDGARARPGGSDGTLPPAYCWEPPPSGGCRNRTRSGTIAAAPETRDARLATPLLPPPKRVRGGAFPPHFSPGPASCSL